MEYAVQGKDGELYLWEIVDRSGEVLLTLDDEEIADIVVSHLNSPLSGYYFLFDSSTHPGMWELSDPNNDIIVIHHDQQGLDEIQAILNDQ